MAVFDVFCYESFLYMFHFIPPLRFSLPSDTVYANEGMGDPPEASESE
jgi:hypothetical protein